MRQNQPISGKRAFMAIWVGDMISVIGTGLTGFSLGVWVFQSTGSATLFALISLCTTLPGILLAPLAGALVDRWDRRKTMLGANIGAALCTLAITLLLWINQLELWHIYVAMSLASLCVAFHRPAYKVAATMLVSKEQYAGASGMMQASAGCQFVISPILAGLLVGTIGISRVVLIDFLSYFVAIGALMMVHIPPPKASAEGSRGRGSLLSEVAQCWRYLQQRSGLLGVVSVLTVGNFMIAFVAVLAAPMMLSFASPAVLGVTMSVAGTGMLIGSIALGIGGGPQRLIRSMTLFMIIGSLGVVLMGVRQNVVLITAACFAFFFTMPFVQGCFDTVLRKKVAHDMQGRMFAVTSGVIQLAGTLAYVVAGPLSEYVFQPLMNVTGRLAPSVGSVIGVGPGRGIALLFIVTGLLAIVVSALGYLNPRMRYVEVELPDVIADEPQLEAVLAPMPM
jgi:MFS transporter, DHA3 family, macrolide efflux protein